MPLNKETKLRRLNFFLKKNKKNKKQKQTTKKQKKKTTNIDQDLRLDYNYDLKQLLEKIYIYI